MRIKFHCQSDGNSPDDQSQSELPSANSVKFSGIRPRMYIDTGDNVTLTLDKVTLTSQKLCQYNNKCDCRKQIAINEAYVFINKILL